MTTIEPAEATRVEISATVVLTPSNMSAEIAERYFREALRHTLEHARLVTLIHGYGFTVGQHERAANPSTYVQIRDALAKHRRAVTRGYPHRCACGVEYALDEETRDQHEEHVAEVIDLQVIPPLPEPIEEPETRVGPLFDEYRRQSAEISSEPPPGGVIFTAEEFDTLLHAIGRRGYRGSATALMEALKPIAERLEQAERALS